MPIARNSDIDLEPSLEAEVYSNLLRTTDFLAHEESKLLKQHGLSSAQYSALRILRDAGEEGLSILEIASRMITRIPDITRLVNRLEASGMVTRTRAKQDKRRVIVRSRKRAESLLASIDTPLHSTLRRALHQLSRDECLALNGLLVKARLDTKPRQQQHPA